VRAKNNQESMTGGVALFVLDRLVETGRINADEIRQLVESLPDEIRAIERRLERLRLPESRTGERGVPLAVGGVPRGVPR
jgi:polyhydroxyalkanoate synthesis regulator phasin